VNVDPQQLVVALTRAGFTVAGRRTGVYVRLSWPARAGRLGSLFVPLDETAPEYQLMMTAALRLLAAHVIVGQNIWFEVFGPDPAADFEQIRQSLNASFDEVPPDP
jgi:hypothetical protein